MTWIRATTATDCGLCGHRIARGELVASLSLARLRRCTMCAGCCPWPNLPPLPEPQVRSSTWVPTGTGTPERLVSFATREKFETWGDERKRGAA